MNFIKYTIPIIVKRTLFRRMKIIKIQQHYKLRILRKKLAAIVIPDDEDDHAEDLLDFFNSENKEKDEEKFDDKDLDKKIEEIGKKIEKNIENKNLNLMKKNKNKNYALEVIKEEKEKDLDNQVGIFLDKIPDLDVSDNDIKDINDILKDDLLLDNKDKNKDNNKDKKIIKEKDINNNNININNNKILNNLNPKKEIISLNKEKEKENLISKILSANNNLKTHHNRLAPISNFSKKKINTPNANTPITNTNKITNINNIINNININYTFENIDFLKKGLGIDQSLNKITFNRNRIHIKDDKAYGKFIDINSQSNFPSDKKGERTNSIKRPTSKGVYLPHINNNLNASTTTLSNETNSVFSNFTNGKKTIKSNYVKNEEIYVDKKCREIIEKAKAEWNFTNKEAEAILVKKIIKNYQNKKKHKK